MNQLKEKMKKKENIIRLILIISLILMIINIVKLIINQNSNDSTIMYEINIIVIFILNIFLVINTNDKNNKRNFILMIILIILNIAIPVSFTQTYENYEKQYKNSNGLYANSLYSDAGVYLVEHHKDIYGIQIFKIEHKNR